MITSKSLEDTEQTVKEFVERIVPGEQAVVVGLAGELGAGKTAFVKGVAKAFGVPEVVTSPTFVIEKIYKLERQPFKHLIHVDAYRLESAEELRAIGFEEIITDPGNLIFVEWPERVREILPLDMVIIEFEVVGENTRRISMK